MEGRPENLKNRGVVNLEREYQPPPRGTNIFVMSQFSYMPDQILGEKNQFSGQNLTFFRVLPSQNITTYSKNFYVTKRLWL